MSTLCFLFHGIRYLISDDTDTTITATTDDTNSTVWYHHPTYQIAVQALYGLSISLIFPVLDGVTIASVEQQNNTSDNKSMGKNACTDPLGGPLPIYCDHPSWIKLVLLCVCYPWGMATSLIVIVSLLGYDTGVQQHPNTATTTSTNQISSFSPISPTPPGDDRYDDEDVGNYLYNNDNENHNNQNHRKQHKTRENDDCNNSEVDATTCHTTDATYFDGTTAAAAESGVFTTTTTITTSTTMTSLQFRDDEDDEDSQQHPQQPQLLSMFQLFRLLLISGTTGAAAFLVCLIGVSSGQAIIVDNRVFLFLEQ